MKTPVPVCKSCFLGRGCVSKRRHRIWKTQDCQAYWNKEEYLGIVREEMNKSVIAEHGRIIND